MKNTKKWKVTLVACFIVVFFAIAFFYIRRFFTDSSIQYKVVTIEKGDISKEITGVGSFRPTLIVGVDSQVSGIVNNVLVDCGNQIKKGDILAQIDDTSAKKDVEKLEAQFSVIEAQINELQAVIQGINITIGQNQRKVTQDKELFKNDVITKEELLTSEYNLALSQNIFNEKLAKLKLLERQKREARINIDIAEITLSNTAIKSPIDGMIFSRALEAGQLVSAGLQAEKIFEVCTPFDYLEFATAINGIDIVSIDIEREITIRVVTSFGEEKFSARIKFIDDNPVIEEGVPSYGVVAILENRNLLLKPGMEGSYEISILGRSDVLQLRHNDLQMAQKYSGESNILIFLRDGFLQECAVDYGYKDNYNVEIISSCLQVGDEIVVGVIESKRNDKKISGIKSTPFQNKRIKNKKGRGGM